MVQVPGYRPNLQPNGPHKPFGNEHQAQKLQKTSDGKAISMLPNMMATPEQKADMQKHDFKLVQDGQVKTTNFALQWLMGK